MTPSARSSASFRLGARLFLRRVCVCVRVRACAFNVVLNSWIVCVVCKSTCVCVCMCVCVFQGPGGKMSSSVESSAIFVTDTPKQVRQVEIDLGAPGLVDDEDEGSQ